MYEGPDRWIYPIFFEELKLEYTDETVGKMDIVFDPGSWWYNTKDDEVDLDVESGNPWTVFVDGVERKPFLSALEGGLNEIISDEGGNNQFDIVVDTPSEDGLENSGFKMDLVSGSDDWTLAVHDDMEGRAREFANAFLGFEQSTDTPHVLSDSDPITDYSLYGVWGSSVVADDKRHTKKKKAFNSGSSHQRYVNRWKGVDHRRFKYFDVAPREVRRDPITFFDASDDRRDENNKFIDLWSTGSESGQEIIVVHGTSFQDDASLDYKYHDWECVKFTSNGTFSEARKAIDDIEGGERYEIEFEGLVTESEWSHP